MPPQYVNKTKNLKSANFDLWTEKVLNKIVRHFDGENGIGNWSWTMCQGLDRFVQRICCKFSSNFTEKISFSNFWKIFFYILLQDLEEAHVKYKTKLDEVLKLQKKCQSAINHQKYRLVFHSVEISGFCCHSYCHFPRLKAIQKHMKDVHPDSDTETEELKDLNKDILRRYEQLKQVWHSQCGIFRNFLPLRFSVKSI